MQYFWMWHGGHGGHGGHVGRGPGSHCGYRQDRKDKPIAHSNSVLTFPNNMYV